MELAGTGDAPPARPDDAGWNRPADWAAAPGGADGEAAAPGDGPARHDQGPPRPVNLLLDPLPPEDGGDEDTDAGEAAGTRPAPYAPGDYEFAFPEGFAPDQGLVDGFRALAAREGIAPELAARLVDFQVTASLDAQAELGRRAADELRRDWGRDFGRNVREARGAVRFVDARLPGFAAWANAAAGTSAEFMRFLHWLGGQTREDALLDGPAPARSEEMTTLEFITEAFRRAARGED